MRKEAEVHWRIGILVAWIGFYNKWFYSVELAFENEFMKETWNMKFSTCREKEYKFYERIVHDFFVIFYYCYAIILYDKLIPDNNKHWKM